MGWLLSVTRKRKAFLAIDRISGKWWDSVCLLIDLGGGEIYICEK